MENLPVPDELADVRNKIRALTDREKALRSILLSDPSSRNGANFAVEIKDVQTSRVDLKELRANHAEIVEQYTFKLTEQRVELRAIDEETGEITRVKRRKNGDTQ